MPDPHERHRALALRWFQEFWNQRRAETIDEMMSRDFVGRLETAPDATFDDFKASHTMLLGAIPDFHVEVLKTVADNDGVAIRWRVTGTHTGSAFGFPPSGKKVDFVGLTWLRFEDDMLVEGWDSWNAGVVFQRLRRARESEIEKRHGLTPRQAQVALLMADRRSTKEIARELEIRPNTARRHCQAVLRRLGVHTRKQVRSRHDTSSTPWCGLSGSRTPMPRRDLERPLRAILAALRDYTEDIVLVGGWVPYLQLSYGRADSPEARTSLTTDADLLLLHDLRRGQRSPIASVLEAAGFKPTGVTGVIWTREPERGETIEFLQPVRGPASSRGRPADIPDQPGLRALALDRLWVLGAFTESLILPPDADAGHPVQVRVPVLGAFVLNKANTFGLRGGEDGPAKGGKDLLYLRDVMAAGQGSTSVVEADLEGMLSSPERRRASASLRRATYHLRHVARPLPGIAARILAERDGIDVAAARADVEGHLTDLVEILAARSSDD